MSPYTIIQEVWRHHHEAPGVVTFLPVVLRVEGEREGTGWALRLHEQGTRIPWAPEVLTKSERESVEQRLCMEERWAQKGAAA